MAVQFELYKTPMPKEKKNKTRYHARPVSFETVNTEKLAYRIHDRSTLRVSDIISTLEELKNEVAQCLLGLITTSCVCIPIYEICKVFAELGTFAKLKLPSMSVIVP